MKKEQRRESLTPEDLRILKIISKNNRLGTIELSKLVGLAPKNLIHRIKSYERLNLISKYSEPVKPKGRRRIFLINVEAKSLIEDYERIMNNLKKLSENRSLITQEEYDSFRVCIDDGEEAKNK